MFFTTSVLWQIVKLSHPRGRVHTQAGRQLRGHTVVDSVELLPNVGQNTSKCSQCTSPCPLFCLQLHLLMPTPPNIQNVTPPYHNNNCSHFCGGRGDLRGLFYPEAKHGASCTKGEWVACLTWTSAWIKASAAHGFPWSLCLTTDEACSGREPPPHASHSSIVFLRLFPIPGFQLPPTPIS